MKVFILDFDGTITTEDTTDLILEMPGDDQIWRIEEEWKRGRIPSYRCMKEQAKFLKGITIEEVRQHLKQNSRTDPNFPRLVDFLKTENLAPVILSEGYDISVEFHGVQKHIEEIYCSKLVTENGILTGDLEVLNERTWNYNEKCLGCCICKVDFLCQLSREFGVTRSYAVGDGESDGCLFQYVDVSFSLNPKYEATYQVKDLYGVLKIMEDL